MEGLWRAIKSLSLWQGITLVLIMLGAAAGTYWLYAYSTRVDTASLPENHQLIPVQYGDIVNQVSTNGNLDFPERETVSFTIKGTLSDLLVAEGETVRPGQELARLDALTVAARQEAIAQARVDLLNAQEALAQLLEPVSPETLALEIAAAEEKVANARFQERQAREDLADLLEPELPTERDIAAQEEAIADARLKLQQAQEALDDLLNPESPTERDIKAREEQVADARLKLQQAVDDRNQLLTRDLLPDYDLQLAQARQADADAERELAGIQDALTDLTPSEQELVKAAQARLKAQINLDTANQTLDDFEKQHGGQLINRRREKAELENTLAGVRDTLANLRRGYADGALGLAYNIRRWEDYVASLETELESLRVGIVSQVEELEADVALAQVALAEAEERLAELYTGPDTLEQAALEAKALAIAANREVAERDLAELEMPEVDPLELAFREARVSLARATLAQALDDLAELEAERRAAPDPVEVALREQRIVLAQASLDQAIADLAQLREDRLARPDPAEVALKEQQIVLAQASLAQAVADLAQLREDQLELPDPVEVALKEQQIASALVKLDDAQEQLEAATLYAPLGGLVSLVNLEPGDAVEPGKEVLEIVDPTVVEVDGILDEIDVLSVRVGTPARVSLDALPGSDLEGIVTEIDDQSRNQQGVVTYNIRIRLQAPPGLKLQEGLSAIANIVLQEERNVLLVPQQALYGTFDQPLVRVLTGQGIAERPVALGSQDDFWVAVQDGLAEGEQIVLEVSEIGGGETGFRQLRRATGGRPRGGGR